LQVNTQIRIKKSHLDDVHQIWGLIIVFMAWVPYDGY